MKNVVYRVITIICCLLLLSGCSLGEIHKQIKITENISIIKGRVELSGGQKGSIIVKRYYLEDEVYVYDSYTRASAEGDYLFYAIPGTYYIAAFVDSNRDVQYQSSEVGNYYSGEYGKPAAITVKPGQTVTVDTIIISGKTPAPSNNTTFTDNLSPFRKNIGRIVGLNDAMFDNSNYSMGMWRPVEFLTQVGGGLLFLQEYQENKIPVLFVHGMNGGPTDWRAAIEILDSKNFQPWVLYYPSGLRLEMISRYLVTAIAVLRDDYDFKQLYVVGHSMGGLVTRSFVQKYLDKFPEDKELIRFVMTVNSPMKGTKSALGGVKNSPIVVPAWRDVAMGSDFLQDINAWEWPKEVPYYLVFSYKTGSSDDGVAQLKSQIPLKLQSEAVRMYGVNNTHVGTLNDVEFLELFNATLAAIR
jgi:pimeloyl-ACP methyl ester carboxylesterase